MTEEEFLALYSSGDSGASAVSRAPILDNVPSWVPSVNPIESLDGGYSGFDELGPQRLRKVAQGATFGGADEAEALFQSLISDKPYNDELYSIRSDLQSYSEANPLEAAALELGGSMVIPGGWMGRGSALIRRPIEAGVEGAVTGYLSGEGSTEERLDQAKRSGALGGLLGVGTGAIEDIAKLATRGASFDDMIEGAEMKSIGLNRQDIGRGMAKSSGGSQRAAKIGAEDPFIAAVQRTKDEGLIKPVQSMAERVNLLEGRKAEVFGDIKGTVEAVDAARTMPVQVTESSFPTAKAYIEKLRGTKAGLDAQARMSEELAPIIERINEEQSLGSVLDMKRALYGTGYKSGLPDGPDIERAIAKDLKDISEKIVAGAEKVGLIPEEAAARFFQGNAAYGQYSAVQKAYLDKIKQDYGADAVEAVLAQLRTSGGVGQLIISATNKGAGVEAGLLAPLLLAARTEGGQDVISKGLRGAKVASQVATPLISNTRTGRVAGQLLDDDEPGFEPGGMSEEEFLRAYRMYSSDSGNNSKKKVDERILDQSGLENIGFNRSSYSQGGPKVDLPDKVTDELLDAVRQVESGGGKYLLSPAGAEGPYQLMPATGKRIHKKLKIKEPYDPYDEEQARRIAKYHLEDGMERFGRMDLALADYNAGHPTIKAALNEANSQEFDAIKQYLPTETALYVPKVYKALLGRA